MAAFGRRAKGGDGQDIGTDEPISRKPVLSRDARRKQQERDKLDATPPWQLNHRGEVAATTGPFDAADVPDDGVSRVDLGGLQIPLVAGFDIRVDAGADGVIVAATVVHESSQMQLGVFAAPRADGIWDEIRAELVESISDAGGQATEHAGGPFGAELHGALAGVRGATTPVRFVGVDGPRWFLRAMLVGAAATDVASAAPLIELLRDTVVVRGRDPLPVREPVPLHLPKEDAPPSGSEDEPLTDPEDG